MLESGVRWTLRKLRGSKKTGDYCWSVYAGTATKAPWYLGGQPLAKPADPAPEDSGEFEKPRS